MGRMEVPSPAARDRIPPKGLKIPEMTVRRLSTYYRVLRSLEAQGDTEPLSSEKMSRLTGFTAAQVRRDLAYFGTFGKRGVGYDIAELQQSLRTILGIDHPWHIALIGVGNLGTALISYGNFRAQGFHIVAAFDNDATKHGRRLGSIVVRPMEDLPRAVQEQGISMAIVTVPAGEAQRVVDAVVAAGIKGILNFAPVKLQVPRGVNLSRVDLSIEIEYLSYLLTSA
jgi:redox-sensing transcriptional repressor